jgi:hypothetical protein
LFTYADKIKTALREGGLFGLTCDSVLAHCAFVIAPSKQKYPDLLKEVGFGRRVRGDAKKLNILVGILPEK